MPKLALSDASLRSLKAPAKGQMDYWDLRFPSFGVRVSSSGSKIFMLNADNSRHSIGRYGLLTLSEARAEAKRLLAEKTLGKVRPQSITFPTAKELFLAEKRKSRRPNTVANHEDRLARHFSFKGQLSEITHQDVARKLAKIKTNSEHDHALSIAKTFFTWCHNCRYIDENPTRGLSSQGSQSRARVLTDTELKSIWAACSDERNELPQHFRTIVKLLILTGQRRGEIGALRPTYIDLESQTICLPKHLVKNSREHLFPIHAHTAAILLKVLVHSQDTDFIFPARGNASASFNGWSKSKATLDRQSGVKGWTLHDLRRTFATNLARMGVAPHIIERLLNHVAGTISGVAAIYNRHHFMPEMRAAIDKYEERLIRFL